MNEMKLFYGPTLEAAKDAAQIWYLQQKGIELTIPAATQQTQQGWEVSLHFQRLPVPNMGRPYSRPAARPSRLPRR
jgi:hypothetical protein